MYVAITGKFTNKYKYLFCIFFYKKYMNTKNGIIKNF